TVDSEQVEHCHQAPIQSGARFSANAVASSRASRLVRTAAASASLTSHTAGSQSEPLALLAVIRLLVRSASGALAATLSASSSAVATTSPDGTTRLTSPHRNAAA